MAYGPQYSSQLGMLAGALGHGLDPSMGLDIYQQTIAQAEAARAQARAERQETLGSLAQLGMEQAASGAAPEQVEAMLRTAAAGLPRGESNTVRQGMHKILGHLQDYEAPVDPMAQLQLENAQLTNIGLQQDLMGAGLDPAAAADEGGIIGPATDAEIRNMVTQYGTTMTPSAMRGLIVNQLGARFNDAQGAPPRAVWEGAVNHIISDQIAQTNPEWAAQNLQAYGAPAPPPPTDDAGGLHGGFLETVGTGAATGGALGAGAGLLGGPLAPISVPVGAVGGALAGTLGGLLGYLTR